MPPRWSKDTPQVRGRKTEKKIIRKAGGRPHPNSGAGHIKWDGSDEDSIIEVKEAEKSHTVKGDLVEKLFQDATRQNKQGVYIIRFGNGITLTGYLGRD